MTKWRPKGYENPNPKKRMVYCCKPVEAETEVRVAYEAGYDRCLADLREMGVHVDGDCEFTSVREHHTISNRNNTGTYVFIPDDEERKE
jgi:hypothetical protein